MKRAPRMKVAKKRRALTLELPPIYGQGDWATKLISHKDRNSESRKRLLNCIWSLYRREPLSRNDERWVTGILVDVLLGNDILPRFRTKSAGGRSAEPDDHKFYIALDSLVISAESGIKGKALWGRLAEKWGYPDGSIKNFITKYRKKAQIHRAQIGDDAIRMMMPFNLVHYRKAR